MKNSAYSIEKIDPFRQLVIDGLKLGAKKHHIHGLVEVDISEPRFRMKQIKESTGESLSFTGFIVYCCARAVDEDKHLHAYRDWLNRLILFDDVDISLPVELSTQGQPVVLQTVIRAANHKSVWEIHREIREIQTHTLAKTPWGRWLQWYVRIPGFIRMFIFSLVQRIPAILKGFNGTVLVTSVGMFGTGGGWGIPLPGHSLCVTVGGIEYKPVLTNGELQNKEHLCLTVSFDHDIIDGAPAARFVQRFTALIQEAAGLMDSP